MATLPRTIAAQNYAKTQVETATIRRAICMLHEKCVQFMAAALDLPAQKSVFLAKSQNILSQLQMSLRVDDSVSEGLFLLYDYCYAALERGNEKDVHSAGRVMSTLRDTFKILAKRPR
jgi:flagellar biosynthetic protein FliS